MIFFCHSIFVLTNNFGQTIKTKLCFFTLSSDILGFTLANREFALFHLFEHLYAFPIVIGTAPNRGYCRRRTGQGRGLVVAPEVHNSEMHERLPHSPTISYNYISHAVVPLAVTDKYRT